MISDTSTEQKGNSISASARNTIKISGHREKARMKVLVLCAE